MKILCIHSLAIHGMASMKVVIHLLGEKVLPLASLYLSGLTNIEGHIKTNVAFEDLLNSSLDIARRKSERLLVYIGYLGSAEQVQIIRKALNTNQDLIDHIVVDPVSGDHGRAYVSESVIAAWPSLLELADWALPNQTELALYSGLSDKANRNWQEHLDAFCLRFPHLNVLVTSLNSKQKSDLSNKIGLCLHMGTVQQEHWHQQLAKHYGGTGDVFASTFIEQYFFLQKPAIEAMKTAASFTMQCIERAIQKNQTDLSLPMRSDIH